MNDRDPEWMNDPTWSPWTESPTDTTASSAPPAVPTPAAPPNQTPPKRVLRDEDSQGRPLRSSRPPSRPAAPAAETDVHANSSGASVPPRNGQSSDGDAFGGSWPRVSANHPNAPGAEPQPHAEEAELERQADSDRDPEDQQLWKHELEKALADVLAKLGDKSTKRRAPLFYDATELFRREFPPTPWLVSGLVTRGGIAIIGAEPKSSKTWLATEIAVAVATGTKVCGEFYAEGGAAAYFYAEDLDKQVRNRIRALLAGRGVEALPVGKLHVCPRGEFIDIVRNEHLAWLVAASRRCGQLDLLVLDPFRDVHSGEEDKSDSMSDVMRRLRVLGELLGCTLLVIHHAPKPSQNTSGRRPGQNLRGSGAIHGSTDSGLYLDAGEGDGRNVFTCTATSQVKGARSAGRFAIELAIEDDEAGEAVRAAWKVTRDVAPPKSKAEAGRTERDKADEAAVVAFVRAGAPDKRFTKTELRELLPKATPPVPEKRAVAAVERLLGGDGLRIGFDGRLRPSSEDGQANS